MTNKEKFVYLYLRDNSNYANGKAIEYISPTEIGREYGLSINKNGYHSSSVSQILLKFVRQGIVIRNDKGHYKIR